MIETGPPVNVGGVDVVQWNPRRVPSRWSRDPRGWFRRVNNFGDLLGPLVVAHMHGKLDLATSRTRRRLLAVGSIVHFARDNDVIWGAGANGKVLDQLTRIPKSIDIRAVRGPETRRVLIELGFDCPEVYGDPALLLPSLLPGLRMAATRKAHDIALLPNIRDFRSMRNQPLGVHVINPRSSVRRILLDIARSRRVAASSLHGLVVAQSLGIPTRRIRSNAEADLKYDDYVRGISFEPAPATLDVAQAVREGFDEPPLIDTRSLEAAFPSDLWREHP